MSVKKILIPLVILAAALLIYFYFVPAFAGKIAVQSAVGIGPISIRFYGIIMALSVLLGYLLARMHSWRFGIDKDEVDNLAFWLTIVGFLGARMYFVIFDYDYFLKQPQEIYKIWHGGLSIYGAILAGLVFLIFYSRNKAWTKYQALDLFALSLPLSQALGRFGNFFNQEAYGYPTDLPWKMFVASENNFFHPTFLYEALGLALVFLMLKKLPAKTASGILFFSYLAGYSLLRFFVEPLRIDSVFILGFRADQIVAFIIICVSFTGIMLRTKSLDKKA